MTLTASDGDISPMPGGRLASANAIQQEPTSDPAVAEVNCAPSSPLERYAIMISSAKGMALTTSTNAVVEPIHPKAMP